MNSVTFSALLTSETLAFPELLPLVGKRVTEESNTAIDRMLDTDFHAFFEAEELADPAPVPSIEEIRAMLSCIPCNLAEEIIADRDER